MLGTLIPWKKKTGTDVKVWHEPDHPIARLRHDLDELWGRFWNSWQHRNFDLLDSPQWLSSRLDFDPAG